MTRFFKKMNLNFLGISYICSVFHYFHDKELVKQIRFSVQVTKYSYFILLYHAIYLDIYYFNLSRDDAPAYNSITNYDVDMDKSH